MEIKKEFDISSQLKTETPDDFLEDFDYSHELFEDIDIEPEFKTESSTIEKVGDDQTEPSDDKMLVYCTNCNKACKYLPEADKSCLTCRTLLLYKCGKCMRLYAKFSTLRHHQTFNCNVEPKFSCDFCHFKSYTKNEIDLHFSAQHLLRDSNSKKCTKCPKKFSSAFSLRYHLKFCGQSEEVKLSHLRYSCNDCSYKSAYKSHLTRHIQTRHFPKNLPENPDSSDKHLENIEIGHDLDTESSRIEKIGDNQTEKSLDNVMTCCSNCNKIWKHLSRDEKSCLTCGSTLRYKCRVCKRIYSNLNSLRRHQILYCDRDSTFSCKQCHFKGLSQEDLARHFEAKHSLKNSNSNKCTKCRKKFASLHYLRSHLKFCGKSENVKRSLMRYSCSHCSYKSAYKSHLRRHIQTRHFSKDLQENPDNSNKHFQNIGNEHEVITKSSRIEIIGYDQAKQSQNRNEFVGNIEVGYEFETESSGIEKIGDDQTKQSHDEFKLIYCFKCIKNWKYSSNTEKSCRLCGSALSYQCKKCIKTYASISLLNQHLTRSCNKVGIKFGCEYCEYRSKDKSQIVQHIYERHLPQNPNLKCIKCEKNFLSEGNLNIHSKTCGKSKYQRYTLLRFSCYRCDYKTDLKVCLTKHIRNKHSARDPEKLKCKNCKKRFTTIFTLRSHLKFCGQSDEVKRSLKHLSCNYCDYSTAYRSHLKRHIQTRHLPKDLPEHSGYNNELLENIEIGHEFKTEPSGIEKISDDLTKPSVSDYSNELFENIEIGQEFKTESVGIEKIVTDQTKRSQDESQLNYSCDYCQYETDSKENLDNHIHTFHLPKDPNSNDCSKCGKKFIRKISLERHLKICGQSKNKNKFLLRYSQEHYEYQTKLKPKISPKISTKIVAKNAVCNRCKKIFSRRLGLSLHLKFCGQPEEVKRLLRRYSCAYCNYKTDFISQFDVHMQTHHLPKNLPENLDHSHELFKNENGHESKTEPSMIRKTHNDLSKNSHDSKLMYCPKCKKTSNYHRYMKKTCRKCKTAYRYRCINCMKDYATMKLFRVHLRRYCYKKIKRSCNLCNYESDRKSDFLRHVRVNHEPKDPNLHKCAKCSKSCLSQSGLQNHLRFCGQTSSYSCDHCNYTTTIKSRIAKHTHAVHLRQVQFNQECRKCGTSFTSQPSYRCHIKTCAQSKNRTSGLKSHLFDHSYCKSYDELKKPVPKPDHESSIPKFLILNSIKNTKFQKSFSCAAKLQNPKVCEQTKCIEADHESRLSENIQAKPVPKVLYLKLVKCTESEKSLFCASKLQNLKVCDRTKNIEPDDESRLSEHTQAKSVPETNHESSLSEHIPVKPEPEANHELRLSEQIQAKPVSVPESDYKITILERIQDKPEPQPNHESSLLEHIQAKPESESDHEITILEHILDEPKPESDHESRFSEPIQAKPVSEPESDHELSVSEHIPVDPEPESVSDHEITILEHIQAKSVSEPESDHESSLLELNQVDPEPESESDNEITILEHIQTEPVPKLLTLILNECAISQKSLFSASHLLKDSKVSSKTKYTECPFKRFNCNYKSDCKSNLIKHIKAKHLHLEMQR